MRSPQIKLANTLTFLGAIPFVAPAVATLLGFRDVHMHALVLSYGAIIASFLSGMHWGLSLRHAGETRINLLITSNIVALVAWASLIIPNTQWQYYLQMACFVLLLLIDYQLTKARVHAAWFYHLRLLITGIVLASLLVMALSQ
jgi:Protein of unknown function (DUF3429)